MLYLDLATVMCIGLLIGTEVCVSAFINPVLWSLDERTQAEAVQQFAARLGRAMPFWYAGSLVLLIVEAVLRRQQDDAALLWIACVLWTAVILATIVLLVPINNRMMKDAVTLPFKEMKRQHTRWDMLHRLRVFTLIVSMFCFLAAVLD